MKASLSYLFIMLALFAGINEASAQGTWTNIASMPQAIVEASSVACDGKFYVMGGSTGGGIAPPQVYDPVIDSWSLKTADPINRSATAAGVINNKIYVAEGWVNADSNSSTKSLEIYNPTNDSWTAGTSSLIARGETAAAVIDGKLYITGGRANVYNGDVTNLEIYDPNTDTWTNGAPIPTASEGAVGAALNGKFYVVGGYVRPIGNGPGSATANVFIYDPATDTWTSGAPPPSPRNQAAGDVINGKLYITGGGTGPDSTNNPVVVYDPVADNWSVAAAEPTPRALGIAAAVGGKLFVAGGYPDGLPPTATAEVFAPSPASPTLTIASVINQSVLFWPASATNYILQSVTNLNSTNWITVSDAVPVIAYTVTNNSTARFFRLQQQQ